MNTATETTVAATEALNAKGHKIGGRANNGRKALIAQKQAKLAALVAIRDNDTANIPSAFILRQLVEAKLVELAPAPLAEGEKRGRGRPPLVPTITGTATSWVKLMERNAAKSKAKAEAKAAADAEAAAAAAAVESEAEAPAVETAETE